MYTCYLEIELLEIWLSWSLIYFQFALLRVWLLGVGTTWNCATQSWDCLEFRLLVIWTIWYCDYFEFRLLDVWTTWSVEYLV